MLFSKLIFLVTIDQQSEKKYEAKWRLIAYEGSHILDSSFLLLIQVKTNHPDQQKTN